MAFHAPRRKTAVNAIRLIRESGIEPPHGYTIRDTKETIIIVKNIVIHRGGKRPERIKNRRK
jgi:hypothetical protein